jgi:hypothetical protein
MTSAGSSSTTRRRNVPAAPRARRLPHQGGLAGQHRRLAQYIPLMGSVEDGIVESFKHGGGCPTRPSPASTRLWPRTAARRSWRPSRPHPAAGAQGLSERLEKASTSGRGMRQRTRPQPHGPHVPQQPLRRLRLLRGGHRPRPRRGREHGTTNVRFEVKDAAALDEQASYD